MTPAGTGRQPPVNLHPTFGCCGVDCGLCPRYHTAGSSRCPGCYGPDFFEKHPSCPFITCCVKQHNHATCAECDEFPCSRFEGVDKRDSFVTKQISLSNLDFVREAGLEHFINQQGNRIKLLETMLARFNEGRSKSYYCLAAALLPIADLEASLGEADREITNNSAGPEDIKAKAAILRRFLNSHAAERGVELRLRN